MLPARRYEILRKAKQQSSMDHIYVRSIKDNPPPVTEPRLCYGFETHTEPKLIALLSHELEEKRLSSLSLLYNYISNHQKIIRLIQFGCLDPLVVLLHDPNELIRQRSAAILSRISVVHAGIDAILQHETAFETIMECLNDESSDIVVTIHSILNHICSTIFVEQAVQRGVIPNLVKSLQVASQDGKLLALDSLYYCSERVEAAIHISLNEGLAPICVEIVRLPQNYPVEVYERAASVLTVMCGHVDGKTATIEAGGVAPLVEMLKKEEDTKTLAIFMECLMAITTDLQGMRDGIRCGLCEIATKMLQSENVQLSLSSIKTISNLAINPKGRELVQPSLDTLRLLSGYHDILISESAKEAIVRVTFVP
ncbi:MAG: hypothetical protein EZS28_028948 [Streblomastix strix]|uniref:Uncharacterized protein n=1 Tax=Streblomastix strix TaxID=222440 RepID=A0A5J4V0G3_9EUKA|nr:MAG: hypothetical protein EZS28_028948 [Streblomastix strix]